MTNRTLVGRAEELARLRAALVKARSGSGQIVLITGEAGIGKTHLARACLAEASTAGMSIGVGRAWDGAGAPAFFAWTSAFEALGHPFKIKRSLTTDVDTFAAVERVAQHAGALCRETPTAILLDDLQWAEAPALLALRLLARSTPEGLFLVGTLRIPERIEAPVAGLLQEIMREVEVISLRGLSPLDLEALPECSGVSPEVILAVHRATGGNPFFAREVLLDSVARTATTERGEVVLPGGARAVLARRLASLGPHMEVIAGAALGPQPRLDPNLVARVLACSQEGVVVAFEAALETGVLVRGTDGTLAFAHDLMRSAAIERLSAARQIELHAGWARALEGCIDPHLVIRGAAHAIAATPSSLDELLRDRAFDAGMVALGQMSFDEASSLLEFAASADERADRLGGAVRAFAALAEAVTSGGDPERGTRVATRALELARKANDPHAIARAAIAFSHKRRLGTTDASLIQILDDALRGLYELPPDAQDTALICALEARLASALQPFVDPPRALSLARRAIARAREAGDEVLLARTLHAARPAFRILDDLDERFEIDTELLYLATKNGDRVLAARARERLCMIAIERGDAPVFDENLQAFVELANETRAVQLELNVLSFRTAQATIRGDIEGARALIAQLETKRPQWSLSAVLPQIDPIILLRAGVAFVTGDHDAYRALGDAPNPPLTRSVFALLSEIRCGRMRQAAELYEQVADRVLSPQTENFVFRAILANAMIVLGDRGRAGQLYEWMAGYAGRHVVWSPYPLYDGSIERLRAGLARLLGDRDAAATHHADAIAAEEAFGAEPFARRTRAEREAAAPIEPSGVASLKLKECVRAASERWQLTSRTSEVLGLVIEGHSNATIAERLGISTRAVELHVTKLLDRAGVDSRAALISRVLGG